MSHPARSLQYLGANIGQSSHLPDTTEPYTKNNHTNVRVGDADIDDDVDKDIFNAPDYAL